MAKMKSKINIILGGDEEYRTTADWPYHVSCGGVVYKVEDRQAKILLLYRSPDFNKALDRAAKESWHLPKGTLHYGESLEDCAIREVMEESGVVVELQAYLGSRIADWVEGIRFVKDHHFFLMKYLGENEQPMDHEHESKKWFNLGESKDLVEWDRLAIDTAEIALKKMKVI